MTTETVTWRPIEEAPKDRSVLLWFPTLKQSRCGWVYDPRRDNWGVWIQDFNRDDHKPTHFAELLRGPSPTVLDAADEIYREGRGE